MTHPLPMGADPFPVKRADPLEQAIAFLLQSHERLLDAKNLEASVKGKMRGRSWIVIAAEAATLDAANTLEAANQELSDTIRDLITTTIMAAVAAMPEPTK